MLRSSQGPVKVVKKHIAHSKPPQQVHLFKNTHPSYLLQRISTDLFKGVRQYLRASLIKYSNLFAVGTD